MPSSGLGAYQVKIHQIVFGGLFFLVVLMGVRAMMSGGAGNMNLLAALSVTVGVVLALDRYYWVLGPLLFTSGLRMPGLPFDGTELGCILLVSVYFVRQAIDFIHHATFGSAFFPPPLCRREYPLLWGPVGGLMSAPRPFFRWFSWKGRLIESLRPLLEAVSVKTHIPLLARRGAYALTVSDCSRSRFPAELRQRTGLLSQVGISQKDWENLAGESSGTQGNPFIVLMTGRLVHWKGFGFGLEAFSRFASGKDDVALHIIGEGPERRFLTQLVSTLGLGEKVVFLGSLDKSSYQAELKRATISLFPSLHEPGAFVVVESLAAGKPVICFDGAEPATEVSEETGFRVPLVTPEASLGGFVMGMERLYSNPEELKKLSSQCRRLSEEFIWNRRLASLPDIYRNVLQQKVLAHD